MQVAGMPLGIHLGMPPQFSGRAPYSVERPFPVVRLRGLPFNAGELDILEFFQARPTLCHHTDSCVCGRETLSTGACDRFSLGRHWAASRRTAPKRLRQLSRVGMCRKRHTTPV